LVPPDAPEAAGPAAICEEEAESEDELVALLAREIDEIDAPDQTPA
jgi:hypothetical protein